MNFFFELESTGQLLPYTPLLEWVESYVVTKKRLSSSLQERQCHNISIVTYPLSHEEQNQNCQCIPGHFLTIASYNNNFKGGWEMNLCPQSWNWLYSNGWYNLSLLYAGQKLNHMLFDFKTFIFLSFLFPTRVFLLSFLFSFFF